MSIIDSWTVHVTTIGVVHVTGRKASKLIVGKCKLIPRSERRRKKTSILGPAKPSLSGCSNGCSQVSHRSGCVHIKQYHSYYREIIIFLNGQPCRWWGCILGSQLFKSVHKWSIVTECDLLLNHNSNLMQACLSRSLSAWWESADSHEVVKNLLST